MSQEVLLLQREVEFLRGCIPHVEHFEAIDKLKKEYNAILSILEAVALPSETSHMDTLKRVCSNFNSKTVQQYLDLDYPNCN